MKKTVGIFVCMLLIGAVIPISCIGYEEKVLIAKSTINSQEPLLKVTILQHMGISSIRIHVENLGNQTAHNVTISDSSFEGNIIYNHRDLLIDKEIEPGKYGYGSTYIFLGFKKFTMTVTVTCDEGISDTTSADGFALFLWCFIP